MSRTIEHPLYVIFQILFDKYGKITKQDLLVKFNELTQFNYDPTSPPDIIFNLIEEYEEIASHARSPITPPQKIDIGYNIFLQTGKFSRALRKWNQKHPPDQTWINFKLHFQDAYDEYLEFDRGTAASAGFTEQHINSIAQRVTDTLQQQQILQDKVQPNQPTQQPPPVTDDTNMLIMQSINLLQEQLAQLQLQQNSRRSRGRRGNRGNNNNSGTQSNGGTNLAQQQGRTNQVFGHQQGGSNNNFAPQAPAQQHQYMGPYQQFNANVQPFPSTMYNQNPFMYGAPTNNPPPQPQQQHQPAIQNRPTPRQPLPFNYCWTHGWCKHNGFECTTPMQGLIPSATLQNRMGGSNKN